MQRRAETPEHLWVLEEAVLVVGAAPGSVEKRVVVATPGAPHHGLLPGLVEAQVGRVDETTQDEVCEVGDEVVKRHPGEKRRDEESRLWPEGGAAALKLTRTLRRPPR